MSEGVGLPGKLQPASDSSAANSQHGKRDASAHCFLSSSSRSSIRPGASMPARIASGMFSAVKTLVCRATTRPATTAESQLATPRTTTS